MRQVDEAFLIQAMRPRTGRRKSERTDLTAQRKRKRDRRQARRLRNVNRRP